MSETALIPDASSLPQEQSSPRTMLAAIALVSFASLLLELSLTRLFSVVLFYHFAFLAISLALLGLGAGGVLAYIARDSLRRFSIPQLGAAVCTLNAFVVVAALEVVLHTSVSLMWTGSNMLHITWIYLTCAVPFFFTGLLFAVVFARENRRVSLLYGADLLGGALACIAVVPALNLIGGPNAVLLAGAMMAFAGALWARVPTVETLLATSTGGADERRSKLRLFGPIAVAALLLVTIAANYSGRLMDIVYAKGMRRDKPWVLFAKWNAISRVEVDQQGESKYIVIDADASTAIMSVDPARWAVDQPVTAPHDNGLPSAPSSYNWRNDLMAAAPAVANVLRPRGDYAIIGPGGGVDVLRAAANGSPSVTGVEINNIIVNDIMKGRYADYAHHLYEQRNVHIHVADGRSFLRASKDKYDVVQMTLVDTWASTAAGAFALSENNLYTTQAFREYFDHLKPDGIIAITRWEFASPREALRVVSQEIEALGAGDVSRNFLIVSDGALDTDGRPVTVLAKNTPFTPEEEAAIFDHLRANKNLHLIYAPSESSGTVAGVEPAAETARRPFLQLIIATGSLHGCSTPRAAFVCSYPYDITPVGDDEPFFFFTLKTRDVLRQFLAGEQKAIDWKVNLGVLVLVALLLISIAAVLLFLIVPLAVHQARRASRAPAGRDVRPHASTSGPAGRVVPLLYFVALGLGYILVEVAFIQRFVLFLGHPVYALTVVVFLMLLSSGAGSIAARTLLRNDRRVRTVLAVIVAGVLACVAALPVVLAGLVGLPFAVKLVLTGLMLIPLGFCMGMPFPTGLRALAAATGDSGDTLIEWAWAMNAAASVLGSVLAMVIAIHLGLNITLAAGAGAYVLAILFSVPLVKKSVSRSLG